MNTLIYITINSSFEGGVHSVARLQKNHPFYSGFVLSLNFNDSMIKFNCLATVRSLEFRL